MGLCGGNLLSWSSTHVQRELRLMARAFCEDLWERFQVHHAEKLHNSPTGETLLDLMAQLFWRLNYTAHTINNNNRIGNLVAASRNWGRSPVINDMTPVPPSISVWSRTVPLSHFDEYPRMELTPEEILALRTALAVNKNKRRKRKFSRIQSDVSSSDEEVGGSTQAGVRRSPRKAKSQPRDPSMASHEELLIAVRNHEAMANQRRVPPPENSDEQYDHPTRNVTTHIHVPSTMSCQQSAHIPSALTKATPPSVPLPLPTASSPSLDLTGLQTPVTKSRSSSPEVALIKTKSYVPAWLPNQPASRMSSAPLTESTCRIQPPAPVAPKLKPDVVFCIVESRTPILRANYWHQGRLDGSNLEAFAEGVAKEMGGIPHVEQIKCTMQTVNAELKVALRLDDEDVEKGYEKMKGLFGAAMENVAEEQSASRQPFQIWVEVEQRENVEAEVKVEVVDLEEEVEL